MGDHRLGMTVSQKVPKSHRFLWFPSAQDRQGHNWVCPMRACVRRVASGTDRTDCPDVDLREMGADRIIPTGDQRRHR